MRMLRLAIFVFAAAAIAVGAFPAEAPDSAASMLDLPAYTAELTRWSKSVDGLREHPEQAASLRHQLPAQWLVVLDRQHFTVSTEWLAAALDRLATNPKLAAETSQNASLHLKCMLQDAQDLAQPTEPFRSHPRAKLDEILKRDEFRSVRAPSDADRFWERLL